MDGLDPPGLLDVSRLEHVADGHEPSSGQARAAALHIMTQERALYA
jgi:hypothetical protein